MYMACNCRSDHEIINIVREVVERVSGNFYACHQLPVHFVHGNTVYVKEVLDKLTRNQATAELKYPLIALYTPIDEDRTDPAFYTKAEVNLAIITGSERELTNEERETETFDPILRPIYRMLMKELKKDKRIAHQYQGDYIPHRYSENYSYGHYGAIDANGEMLSDPIDVINIKSLRLEVKPIKNCSR